MADKPKILICASSPEGVSDYLREKFKDWDIIELPVLPEIQRMSFDAVWIDELVRYTPMIVDIPIDKPEKVGKLRKHLQPFWTKNWRK